MTIASILHTITASIGVIQLVDGDPREAEDILRSADAAMYKAKTSRKGTHYA